MSADSKQSKFKCLNLLLEESEDYFPFRMRIHSKPTHIDFKRRWPLLKSEEKDSASDDEDLVQSSDDPKRDEMSRPPIQEFDVEACAAMEAKSRFLPLSFSAGLFATSCLLLLPLIIILRRYS